MTAVLLSLVEPDMEISPVRLSPRVIFSRKHSQCDQSPKVQMSIYANRKIIWDQAGVHPRAGDEKVSHCIHFLTPSQRIQAGSAWLVVKQDVKNRSAKTRSLPVVGFCAIKTRQIFSGRQVGTFLL
jgi:hypothetical protein